ncbi:zinc finger protein 40 isoform B [Alligator mississippiensis]|uniref:Zinc finger protein 40 isoform B n=1 Tax=Alligator mississippiensis TaxID=8496 RepID=A0A151N0U2_ALLMI|nr:zinc finger protein 40 isoform B [Alligator mississippiensis]
MPRTKQIHPRNLRDKIEEAQKELNGTEDQQKEGSEVGTRGTPDAIKGVKRKKIVTENHLKKIPKSPLRNPPEAKLKQNWKNSLNKRALNKKKLTTSEFSNKENSDASTEHDKENSSTKTEPRRVKIFDGGYKSNEDYVYVRGRGRGKYICEECGIRCKKPSMLKKHIRTHTDVRPYHCNYCNFSFKTKGNLTKHMKSKAHSKKCMDLGISVGLIDDQDGDEYGITFGCGA